MTSNTLAISIGRYTIIAIDVYLYIDVSLHSTLFTNFNHPCINLLDIDIKTEDVIRSVAYPLQWGVVYQTNIYKCLGDRINLVIFSVQRWNEKHELDSRNIIKFLPIYTHLVNGTFWYSYTRRYVHRVSCQLPFDGTL